jgi:hypothetical protein
LFVKAFGLEPRFDWAGAQPLLAGVST